MKQFLFIVLAIATFSGCVKHEEEPQPPQERGDGAIGFVTSVFARGASIETTTITNFGVFGYGTGDKLWNEAADEITPTLFDNVKVARNGVIPPYTWDYTGDDVIWGEGFLLNFTFFGYSPMATGDYNASTTPDGNGIVAPIANQTNIPKIGYTALDNVQLQVDLLTAEVRDMKASVSPVLMRFNHALSRIGFKAFSITAAGTVTKIDKIELTNVRYKGSLTLDGSWYSSEDRKDFTLTYTDTQAIIATTAIDEDHPTDISDGDTNGYFMLLPQDLATTASSKIIFHYSVGGTSVPPKEYVIKENWGKGKSITYTVDLTATLEAPLNVTKVTITDWAMGTNESGESDGSVNTVTLTYNDDGAVVGTEKIIQNGELSISKHTANTLQAWNTKPDGSGEYYGVGDAVILEKNMTLYNVDNTVTIGGMRWLRGNLSGTAGSATGYYTEGNPTGSGMFFKWGDTWVYQRESGTTDGLQGDRSFNASKEPQISSTNKLGYDYIGLKDGRASGDPCKKLGENFMTPTSAQFASLIASGEQRNASYRGVIGVFLGAKAAECNDTKIVEECIFLPYTGVRSPVGDLSGVGLIANYWTSTANAYTTDGNFFTANAGLIRAADPAARGAGLSVRCVSTDVNVGGVNWTTSNLEGATASAKGHRMASTPQAYGHFFKWGDMWVYQRESSKTDLLESVGVNYTWRAATVPGAIANSEGYDYLNVSGGPNPGDPCKMLGTNYRTPTAAQYNVLIGNTSEAGSYKGINGRFFGAKARECTNDEIAKDCIFIPFAGYRDSYFNGEIRNDNAGLYWLSSASDRSIQAKSTSLSAYVITVGSGNRGDGYSVRCVRDATIN